MFFLMPGPFIPYFPVSFSQELLGFRFQVSLLIPGTVLNIAPASLREENVSWRSKSVQLIFIGTNSPYIVSCYSVPSRIPVTLLDLGTLGVYGLGVSFELPFLQSTYFRSVCCLFNSTYGLCCTFGGAVSSVPLPGLYMKTCSLCRLYQQVALARGHAHWLCARLVVRCISTLEAVKYSYILVHDGRHRTRCR
jgi:hypothetical protein